MDAAQVWTVVGAVVALIAAFSAVMFSALGMFSRALRAELRSEIGSLRAEISSVQAQVGSEAGSLRSEIASLSALMDARFTGVDHRLDALEQDMQLVKAHLIGQRSA